jgi:hypothetical protein
VISGARFPRTVALALGVLFLTLACQQAPPAPKAAPEVDHAAEGRKAIARQDWAAAASHFRIAAKTQPNDLGVHYGLAIATSWLDLRDEAIQEFQWVAVNGPSNSEEVRVARDWLANLGRPPRVAATVATDAPVDERVGSSRVQGRVTGDEGPLKRFQVHLYALGPDGKSKGISFHVRTDQDGQYTFANIPPGIYKLTDNNVGAPQWRLKVEVKPREEVAVDLTPRNAVRVRDDFPKSG